MNRAFRASYGWLFRWKKKAGSIDSNGVLAVTLSDGTALALSDGTIIGVNQ